MTTSEILNFTKDSNMNESIQRYEFHEYEPVARTNLNSAGEIRINIEQQDLFTQPSEASVRGKINKANDTAYADANA